MTEDEALVKLAEIAKRRGYDHEIAHSDADDLLIQALRHLGWTRLADEWEAQAKNWWWA